MAATDLVTEGQIDSLNASLATAHNALKGRVTTLEAGGGAPSASETVAGVVELATTAEATAGTDTTRAVTAAGVAAVKAALKAEILGAGVPSALDTLDELAAALGDDANFASSTTTALGNRLRVDAAQGLTSPQQAQGRANLGIVASTADFAADFAAAVA